MKNTTFTSWLYQVARSRTTRKPRKPQEIIAEYMIDDPVWPRNGTKLEHYIDHFQWRKATQEHFKLLRQAWDAFEQSTKE